MIEHLAEPASEQQEPEEEYAVARVLADQGPSGAPFCLCLPFPSSHQALASGLSPEGTCHDVLPVSAHFLCLQQRLHVQQLQVQQKCLNTAQLFSTALAVLSLRGGNRANMLNTCLWE